MTPADRLKNRWSGPETVKIEGETVLDELNAARESALLHAKALDETKRDLARLAAREKQAHREIDHLRKANQQLQHTLEAIRRLL